MGKADDKITREYRCSYCGRLYSSRKEALSCVEQCEQEAEWIRANPPCFSEADLVYDKDRDYFGIIYSSRIVHRHGDCFSRQYHVCGWGVSEESSLELVCSAGSLSKLFAITDPALKCGPISVIGGDVVCELRVPCRTLLHRVRLNKNQVKHE